MNVKVLCDDNKIESEITKKLIVVKNIKKYFPVKKTIGMSKEYVKAVDDVSFHLNKGETYGLVGESGCGKSTLSRTILRLVEATEGEVIFKEKNILKDSYKKFKKYQKELQMVFQDPYSSLNPRKRIGQILEEPLKIFGLGNKQERVNRVYNILEKVGIPPESYYRYPHEFSGGQRQRFGLARALILNPELIICDEPVSALDVSIQSQIINLLEDLQEEMGLTYLFVSHDLSVVRHISDRIGVMYLGNIVEEASAEQLFENPLHPYTKALLNAIPEADPNSNKEKIYLRGEIPSPINPPSGCKFHTRCLFATDICKKEFPIKKEIYQHHSVACHLYNNVDSIEPIKKVLQEI